MTTDIHTHLGTSPNEVHSVNEHNFVEETEMLISRMDTFDIDRAVLVPDEPMIPNDLYIKATELFPDRLFFACSIVPRPIDQAKAKLEYYLDEGCKALVLSDETYYPSDPAVLSLIQLAVSLDLPVYLKYSEVTYESISFLDSILTVYPSGKFVVLNMGGLFGFPQLAPLIARKNLWLELSTAFIRLVESPLRIYLDALVQDIGVRKLVFGSGYHSQYADMMGALNLIDLNVETSRLVLRENAWLILGVSFS